MTASTALRRIDAELRWQLARAEAAGRFLAVIVGIEERDPAAAGSMEIPPRLKGVLDRVSLLTGAAPEDVNLMASVATAYVSGPAPFIRELLDQPEIVAAMPAAPSGL